MSNDADACVPKALTDFVFDLFDSVTLSQLPEEQSRHYSTTFRSLSQKYFGNTPWPSPTVIASECNGDPLFLALYRELSHRHWHAVSRVTLRDRIEGWHVYRDLFEEILVEQPDFYIIPAWAFEILNEFVYQFQGYCQFRTALYSTAVKHGILREGENASAVTSTGGGNNNGGGNGGGGNQQHGGSVVENLQLLATNEDAWEVETVYGYLHRLVEIGCSPTCTKPAYQYLGTFASVSLSRLECLVGDYTSSLQALSPIVAGTIFVSKKDTNDQNASLVTQSATEVIQSVFGARLSMTYHAGVSFIMLRRYKDAARILGEICAAMQRMFKTGQIQLQRGNRRDNKDKDQKENNQEHQQYVKQYERMISLLAIVTHACPPEGIVEDSVLRTIREKHGSTLSKIDAGEEGYENLFQCPKFVSVVSNQGCSEPPSTGGGGGGGGNNSNVYKLQIKQFGNELSSQYPCRKLRSYLKLYTSIAVSKLAKFNDMNEQHDVLPLLLSYKHKMRQLESSATATGGTIALATVRGDDGEGEVKEETPASTTFMDGCTSHSAMDIHYYLVKDMVHIDEAEKQRRFEKYFIQQIHQNCDIIKDAHRINTTV